jgi:hypothetical protein
VLATVKAYVKEQHKEVPEEWDLSSHVYGKGTHDATGPGEIFIVAEAIAPTQQLASSIASVARIGMIVSCVVSLLALARLTTRSMRLIQAKKLQQAMSGLGSGVSLKSRWAHVLSSQCIISWT